MKRLKETIIFAIIVAVILATMVFSGCKTPQTDTTVADTADQEITSEETQTSESAGTQKTWSLEEASKPYAGVTLRTIIHPWAGGLSYEPVIQDFIERTGIIVEYEALDLTEQVAKASADFIAGTSTYDFMGMLWNNVGKWTEIGMLEPMESYLNNVDLRDPNYTVSGNGNIHPSFISTMTWDDKLYGTPMYTVISFGIYRKDIADNEEEKNAFKSKYGYEMEFPPKTPEMYQDICEFFTRKAGEKLAGEVLENDFYGTSLSFKRNYATTANFEKFYVPFGGWYFDSEGNANIDTPEAENALNFMLSLREFSPPGYLEATWDEQVNQYILGNVFMYDSWTDTFPYIEDPSASTVAGKNGYFEPAPWKDGAYTTEGNFHGISILKKSKNKEAAFLFIQYINGFEVQKKYHLNGGTSFRLDVCQDEEVREATPYIDTMLDILGDPEAMLPLKGYPYASQIFDIVMNTLNTAAADEISAKEALEYIQSEAEKLISEN